MKTLFIVVELIIIRGENKFKEDFRMRKSYLVLLYMFRTLMIESGCRERNLQLVDFGGFFNTIYRCLYLGRDDYTLEGRSLSEYKVDGRLKGLFSPRAVYLTSERLTIDLLSKEEEFNNLLIPSNFTVEWNGKKYTSKFCLQHDYDKFMKDVEVSPVLGKLKEEFEIAIAKLDNNSKERETKVLTASEFMEVQDAIVANLRKTPEHNTNLEELVKEVELASISSRVAYNGRCHYSEPAFLPLELNVQFHNNLWLNTDNSEMIRELTLSIIRQFK